MTVSLVQVAVSLPLFLFTLPAGALADVLDSRRFAHRCGNRDLAVSVIFAGLVSAGLATPTLLLATTFLLGVGGALTSPAWGAIIPTLVPKEDLDGATAANGAGFNIGRAAGPALGAWLSLGRDCLSRSGPSRLRMSQSSQHYRGGAAR
jgi:MFS family permease